MSSDSMDEGEFIVPLLFDDSNEDYMETCDDEVNHLVPRLEKLCICDDESINLSSDNMNTFGFLNDDIPSSVNSFVETPMDYTNEKGYPLFFGNLSNICLSEAIKAAVSCTKSQSGTEDTSQLISTNTKADIQSKGTTQTVSAGGENYMHPIDAKEEKTLNKSLPTKEIAEESVCGQSPRDLSLNPDLKHSNEAKSCSVTSENKTEPLTMFAPEKMKRVDPETGEMIKNSNVTLSDTPGSSNMGNNNAIMPLDQCADEMARGVSFDSNSSKLSYSADISSDDQSHKISEIMTDSPPDALDIGAVNAASGEDKRSKNIIGFVTPTSGRSDIRQRRFGNLQPPSSIAHSTEISKFYSSSDEDSKKLKVIGKGSPVNSKRKSRKNLKSSPRPITRILSNVGNDEGKRPSPSKRKKTSFENSTDISGKFRKRCLSEHNLETGENSSLIIRSRSLSPDVKPSLSTSVAKPSEISTIPKSRKRALSNSQSESLVKSRKSSSSSDDANNQ